MRVPCHQDLVCSLLQSPVGLDKKSCHKCILALNKHLLVLYREWRNKYIYNPLINFRAILFAILGHVIPNRWAGIRQYTPSVSIFAQWFFSGKKAWQSQQSESIDYQAIYKIDSSQFRSVQPVLADGRHYFFFLFFLWLPPRLPSSAATNPGFANSPLM